MGTHPIFESDFDCLTEWDGFWRSGNIWIGSRSSSTSSIKRKKPVIFSAIVFFFSFVLKINFE